ncbi:MAG: AMP-binding protein [Desulfomonilia bacterium]
MDQHAKSRPGKVCIRLGEREVTFSELSAYTRALGAALKKGGIGRGDRVTVVLPNIPEFVISYMAVVGLGAVVVPVNPSFTPRELRHILTDSDSKAIILEHANLDTYTAIEQECRQDIVITTGNEGTFSQWVRGPGEAIGEDMDPDDVAVMIYSSGLTGEPMGAMLTHANLDHNSDLMRLCMGADDSDTTLTLIPCFHSFSASANMLSMLRYGGTIHLVKKLDFKELHHALSSGAITSICAVPTLFFGLVTHPDLQDVDYSGVKTLVAGGSALSLDIYNAFKERFHRNIRQGYGITEASPVCTCNYRPYPIKPESIGIPVPGVQARIVDEQDRVLKPGERGEILFTGPNIMKGYYKKEHETRNVIRDGWLYTGDLGFMDEDGYIYITGYKKDMVITSGFNVYCREVQDVLNSLPGVKDSAITGEADLMRGAIIKAFVVSDDSGVTENDIKRSARKLLASYKTPRKVVFVREIPRDENGRVIFEGMEPVG